MKNLSNRKIYFGFTQKGDHQAVGKTYDLGTRIAESAVDAIAVGTISPGDRNLAVPDGDDVAAVAVGDSEFLIDFQVYCADDPTMGGDFGHGRRGAVGQKNKAQTDASGDQTKKQDNPIF